MSTLQDRVERSLLRTAELFEGNYGEPVPVDPTAHELRTAVKIASDYGVKVKQVTTCMCLMS